MNQNVSIQSSPGPPIALESGLWTDGLENIFEIQKIRIVLGISTVPMSTKSNRKRSTKVFRSVH